MSDLIIPNSNGFRQDKKPTTAEKVLNLSKVIKLHENLIQTQDLRHKNLNSVVLENSIRISALMQTSMSVLVDVVSSLYEITPEDANTKIMREFSVHEARALVSILLGRNVITSELADEYVDRIANGERIRFGEGFVIEEIPEETTTESVEETTEEE